MPRNLTAVAGSRGRGVAGSGKKTTALPRRPSVSRLSAIDPATALRPLDGSPWYVYLLRCADGTLYGGVTTDVDRRTARHNAGTGARYTRARRPVTLAWTSPRLDKVTAHRLEWRVKRLERETKVRLVAGPNRALVRRLLTDLQPHTVVTIAQVATTTGAGTPHRNKPSKAARASRPSRG